MLLVFVGCAEELQPPHDDLLGVWKTDAPRYRGRFFEVRSDALVFGTGEFDPSRLLRLVGVIPSDSKATDGEGWILRYREDDGALIDLEVFVRPGPNARLRFANREEVWRRTRGTSGETKNG